MLVLYLFIDEETEGWERQTKCPQTLGGCDGARI